MSSLITKTWIVALLAGIVLHAQGADKKIYFEHLDMKEGLSDNTVYCILQDKQGFIWFGTKRGLSRYDGRTFRLFNKEMGKDGIGKNMVYTLSEDRGGKIWLGTFSGVYIYDPDLESFSKFSLTSDKGSQIRGLISNIKTDLEGNVWIAENSVALYKYEPHTGQLVEYRHDPKNAGSLPPGHISNILVGDDELWLAMSDQGIALFNSRDQSFSAPTANNDPLKKDQVRVLQDYRSTMFIGTKNGGLKVMDKISGEIKTILKYDSNGNPIYVRDLKLINDTELWIASESGLYIYYPETGDYQNLKNDINDPFSISDNALYVIEEDRDGGIWIGTYFSGINYLPNHPTQFEKYYPVSNSNSISGKRVREFVMNENGQLWIGTEDAGLNLFDPLTNTFENFTPDTSGKSISYHNIHGLALRDNTLLIGIWSQGLNILDQTTKSIKADFIQDMQGQVRENDIFSIFIDRKNNVWLGTTEGLFLYHEVGGYSEFIREIGHCFVYDMMEDHLGQLWVATLHGGIFKLDAESRTVRSFIPDVAHESSLSHYSVITLLQDSKNRIWVGTEGGGFCFYDEAGDSFSCFNDQNGFPSTHIYKILEGNDGNLWMSTNKGLMEFDPVTEKYRIFTKDNGLINSPFNYKSGIKTKEGKLYFGTLNGFISFDPATFRTKKQNAPIIFTDFYLSNQPVTIGGNQPILEKSITKTRNLRLRHDQNSLSFGFAVLDYTASNSLSYAYMMEGYDRDWTYLSLNQRINYSFLPPGNYKLRVKTTDIFGNWNDEEATLQIEILPPFWKTDWAYLAYASLLLLLTVYLINSYKKRLNNRHQLALKVLEDEKEKEIYQSKIEFFTNITHEIRTPLTLIKAPLEHLLRKSGVYEDDLRENLMIMDKNTNRLIDLSNQLLDFRKTEKKGFSLNFIRTDITALLQETYVRFKNTAQQKSLNFFLKASPNPLFADVDKEALTKILSNLYSNAIKNAFSYVQIELKHDHKKLKIMVGNDGNIIASELHRKIFEPFFQISTAGNGSRPNSGTGLGLPLAKSLAEMHGGKLYLDTKEREANVFILELPIQQKKAIHLNEIPPAIPESRMVEEEIRKYGKPTLLVVEDNKELLDFLAGQLKPDHFILGAKNGKEALQILDEEPVDLIISDVMMPVMDGYNLCRSVKSNIAFSHIPFILLTAKNTMQSKIEGLEMGADVYIEKPFSVEYVHLQVKNLLNYRDQIRKSCASQPFVEINTLAHTRADEEFLEKVNAGILAHLDNQQFGVNELAEILCMSQSSLLRKIKGISQMTPNSYIRLVRLKKAAQLLQEGEYSIAEVGDLVGFNSPSYFTKCFQKQFGKLPKDFYQRKTKIG
ncbi:two-component regulator propeller domain-containing protein [Negadavirga shengliensis]|uniref:histidine kinase n=1 Tax=Negadavirga shengliensis TaxID=1389218 RepID=A0ABV9SXB1_9BACT